MNINGRMSYTQMMLLKKIGWNYILIEYKMWDQGSLAFVQVTIVGFLNLILLRSAKTISVVTLKSYGDPESL